MREGRAKRMLDTLGVIRPGLRRAFDKLTGILPFICG